MWNIATDYLLYGVCLALSILLALLSAFGGDILDFDADGGMDTPGAAGLPRYSLFNPLAFLALLGGFGAAGLIARGLGAAAWLAFALALAGGTLVSIAVFYVFRSVVLAAQGSEAPPFDAAIGKLGTITVAIPNNGLGVVTYVIGGQRLTLPARHAAATPVASGTEVVIVDLHQSVAIVREFATTTTP